MHSIQQIQFGAGVISNAVRNLIEISPFTKELTEIVNQWPSLFLKEATWVQTNLGVPSLIVRVDYTVEEINGKKSLGVYEIEDKPCGLGLTYLLNPIFKDKWDYFRANKWPDFGFIRTKNRSSDDHLVLNETPEVELRNSQKLAIFRQGLKKPGIRDWSKTLYLHFHPKATKII